MSTVPGPQSWSDAGLVPVDPEEPLRLTDTDEGDAPDERDAEEYAPAVPRADLEGEADEADVVDQAAEVPLDEDEEPDA